MRFTRPQYEALRRETSVFSDAFAMLPDIDSRIDGRMMAGTLVTGNFFQVLGVGAALGRTLTPADDERFAGRPVVVLSHRGWTRQFANDPGVLGRSLLVNGFSYQDRRRHAGGLSRAHASVRPTTGRRSRFSASSAESMQGAKTPSASTSSDG